jgi:hypothetical protein
MYLSCFGKLTISPLISIDPFSYYCFTIQKPWLDKETPSELLLSRGGHLGLAKMHWWGLYYSGTRRNGQLAKNTDQSLLVILWLGMLVDHFFKYLMVSNGTGTFSTSEWSTQMFSICIQSISKNWSVFFVCNRTDFKTVYSELSKIQENVKLCKA